MEVKQIVEEINKTVHDLREAVDKKSDKEAIEKIQNRLDELEVKAQRINTTPVNGQMTEVEKKELDEFKSFARSGNIGSTLEKKAMSSDSMPNGGVFLPENIATDIITRVRKISPVRQVASVVSISKGNDYKMPREANTGYGYGWVGERQNRTDTDNDTFQQVVIPVHEMYAQPKLTQDLIDDSAFNFESYIAQRVSNRFAQVEASAFVSGDGVNKPKGFLNDTDVEQVTAALTFDGLIQLVYELDSEYSNGAVFMAKRSTIRTIRTLKDNNDQYLWQPSAQVGQPATLLGYQIYEADDMPTAATNALSVAFGNFNEGYQIVDKAGITTIRDQYTEKPFIKFYTTKRVGGGVKNPDAIKLLKQS